MGIGKPEIAHAAIVELTHFCHHFLGRINAHLLAFDHRVDAVAAVVGAAPFGLHANVEVLLLQVVVEFWPNLLGIGIITGSLFNRGGHFMNHAIARLCLSHHVAAFVAEIVSPQQLFQ